MQNGPESRRLDRRARHRLGAVRSSDLDVKDWEDIARVQQRIAKLPRLDDRSDDDIIGYDEAGLPC